jgi:hypothetical protein
MHIFKYKNLCKGNKIFLSDRQRVHKRGENPHINRGKTVVIPAKNLPEILLKNRKRSILTLQYVWLNLIISIIYTISFIDAIIKNIDLVDRNMCITFVEKLVNV